MPDVPRASRLIRYRRRAGALARLSRTEWGLLVRMGGLLVALLMLQRMLPLPNLLRLFDPRTVQASGAPLPLGRVVRLTRRLLGMTFRDHFCMKQAVLLFHFLRKWGYAVQLHFGVARVDDALSGHAWIDLDGEPFAEYEDPRTKYQVTYSYPPA